MIDTILYILLFLAFCLLIINFIRGLFKRESKLGIEGKLIWMDKGRSTKPFYNNVYNVSGKPDLMYRISGGVLAVEYKSRYGDIYESDIIQAKCAALAARGRKYNVIRILVKTSSKQQYFNLPKNDHDLFNEIEQYISLTNHAKSGAQMNAVPMRGKCRSCAYKYECKYAIR